MHVSLVSGNSAHVRVGVNVFEATKLSYENNPSILVAI